MRYLAADMWPMSMESEEKWFERMVAENRRTLTIETLPSDGQPGVAIGNCSLFDVDARNQRAELGIVIGEKEYWSQGYGTDAIKTMLRYAFDEMNLRRVYLRVYAANTRAMRCYEKCGFRTEGRLRQHVYRNGVWHDEIIMAVLRDEFTAQGA
jgi:RimJ/RimL family protein N-acetyltransferase